MENCCKLSDSGFLFFNEMPLFMPLKTQNLVNKDFTRLLVEKMGLEPTTFWLPAKRSSQLSYIPKTMANLSKFILFILFSVFNFSEASIVLYFVILF